MKKLSKNLLLCALALSGTVFMSSHALAAANLSMDANMQKCETAFKNAQNGNMTQAAAWRARVEHKQLVREILKDVNQRNANVSVKSGEALSDIEVLNNFKVMGRLLEMLAAEHPAETDEWGVPLE